MFNKAVLNKTAPQPALECWVQGSEPEFKEMHGSVILIEVIQVNCPGCFVHALPEAIRLHKTYATHGLKVFAIATAFEDFHHNTLNNLQRLLQQGELIGEALNQLGKAGFLDDSTGKLQLPYTIPFSVAMDKLLLNKNKADQCTIDKFILAQVPDFHEKQWLPETKQSIYQQAENHLNKRQYRALTFDMFNLQGTPSSILIDKKGILRAVLFGAVNTLEHQVEILLDE